MDPHEFIAHAYGAWNSGDTAHFPEFFHEEAVYETSGLFPGFQPTYHRPAGLSRFYEQMLEAWESFEIDVLEVVEEPDSIIARLRFRARGMTSGVEVDTEFAHGWRLRGDQAVELYARRTVDEVRERLVDTADPR